MKIRNTSKDHEYAVARGWVDPSSAPTGLVSESADALYTSETDTTKRLAPDGAGGVLWHAGLVVDDEGTPLATAADTLNFVGSGVTATGTGATKTITIPGVSATTTIKGNDVTPALSNAMPAWVKPTGTGVITNDAQGRLTIDSGSAYKAFPGITFLEGRLHLVYRSGTDHVSSHDGVVKYRTSDDLGRTWSSATTIASPSGSDDLRDPSILALSFGRLVCAYFRYNTKALDIRVRYSDNRGQTWSSEYTVPSTFTGETGCSAQPIELPDGTILLPGYGYNTGATVFSSALWKSTDGGLTFPTQVAVASGTPSYTEWQPRVLASGKIVGLIRDDNGGHTYRTVSTDGGATWSAPSDVISSTAGRPGLVEFYPSALLWFGRGPSQEGRWAVSWDEGVTWTALQEVDAGNTLAAMYHSPVVLAPGYIAMAYALENTSTDADLYLRYYHDGYGTDPLGQAYNLIYAAAGLTGATAASRYVGATASGAPASGTFAVGDFIVDQTGKLYVCTVAGTPGTWVGTGTGTGTVTSVAATVPAEFSISGSPITTSGTLAITKATEPANTVWAGPTSGADAAPTFRALVAADIPSGVGTTDHEHIMNLWFSGDGSTTAFELPAAPFDSQSVRAWVGSTITDVTLSGTMLTTMTFGSAPASGTNNIIVDLVAAAA